MYGLTICSPLQLYHRQTHTHFVTPPICFITEGVSPASKYFWSKKILFRKCLRNYSRYLTIFNCVGSSFDICFCPYDWICSISPLLNRTIGNSFWTMHLLKYFILLQCYIPRVQIMHFFQIILKTSLMAWKHTLKF